MFKSYQFIGYIGYNPKTNHSIHQYKIVDSEFGDIMVEVEATEYDVLSGARVIAQVYEKRGYTVSQIAKQLYLVCKQMELEYNHTLNMIIWSQKKYNTELWDKYGKEIQKFILFS